MSPTSRALPVLEEEPRPRRAGEIGSWDVASDVVVVGCGCAGAAAAIEAARHGAEVVLMERAGGPGGASALSGGWIYLGGGTPLQRACGFDDTAEAMTRFLAAALGPDADLDKVAEYSAGSVEHFDWLASLGVPFGRHLVDTRERSPRPGDGLAWMGEDSAPLCDLATPAPRGHRPDGAGLQGAVLMACLWSAASASAAALVLDARAEALVTGADGRIVGVVARQYGNELTVRAHGGVVLASGGFGANDHLLERWAPQLLGHSRVGTDGDDGSGIALGLGAGAATRHMGTGQVALGVAPALLAPSVVVDGSGRRFINEDTYPGRVGQAALFSHDARAFAIVGEEVYESVPEAERLGQVPAYVASSAAELAEEIGVAPGELQETLGSYDEAAAQGVDSEFGKAARWLRHHRPPLGAFDLRAPGRLGAGGTTDPRTGFGVFTLGGLVTDPAGRVLDHGGASIPGLFAAGRAASGLHGWGYITGTSIGDGTFFGRRAGHSAAAEAQRRVASRRS